MQVTARRGANAIQFTFRYCCDGMSHIFSKIELHARQDIPLYIVERGCESPPTSYSSGINHQTTATNAERSFELHDRRQCANVVSRTFQLVGNTSRPQHFYQLQYQYYSARPCYIGGLLCIFCIRLAARQRPSFEVAGAFLSHPMENFG